MGLFVDFGLDAERAEKLHGRENVPDQGEVLEDHRLVREQGFEALTARNLSKRIGCSTQPILYHFADMKELRKVMRETEAFFRK